MKITKALIALVAFCFSAASVSGEIRDWTDSATSRTIKGELLKVDGGTASIKLTDGRIVSVSIERLVDSD